MKLRYYAETKQMFHICKGEEEEENMTIPPGRDEIFECPTCGKTWDLFDWRKALETGEA